jgi:outer membrane beta-barrel protein
MMRIIKPFLIFLLVTFVHAAETDLYDFSWLDSDKEVYVLQNRKFRKKNKFHFSAGFGMTTSGSFVDATTIQGRGGYFFSEDFGFEVVYAMNDGSENEAATSVRSSGVVPFRRLVDSYIGGMLLWSPFYAKINTFNSILYVDFIFGIGAASLEETNNRPQFLEFGAGEPDVTLTHTGAMWNFTSKFYINQSWNIRFDITGIHYQAQSARDDNENSGDVWYDNVDMSLALGFDL